MSRPRAARERALFLAALAFLAFMPPLLLVADHAALVFGVPVFLVYVFACWSAVIIAAAVIAPHLRHRPPGP